LLAYSKPSTYAAKVAFSSFPSPVFLQLTLINNRIRQQWFRVILLLFWLNRFYRCSLRCLSFVISQGQILIAFSMIVELSSLKDLMTNIALEHVLRANVCIVVEYSVGRTELLLAKMASRSRAFQFMIVKRCIRVRNLAMVAPYLGVF
jgi:hypothetical protein